MVGRGEGSEWGWDGGRGGIGVGWGGGWGGGWSEGGGGEYGRVRELLTHNRLPCLLAMYVMITCEMCVAKYKSYLGQPCLCRSSLYPLPRTPQPKALWN